MPRLKLVFAAVALAALACVAMVWGMGRRVASVNAELLDAEATEAALVLILATTTDAESGQRGYLLTRDEELLAPYRTAREQVRMLERELRAMADSGQLETKTVEAVIELVETRLTQIQNVTEMAQQGRTDEVLAFVRSGVGRDTMQQLRTTIGEALARVRADQEGLMHRRDAANQWLSLTALLGAATTLLFLIWTYNLLQRDRLQRQAAELQLAEGQRRLAGIVASAMDAIISIDEGQKIILFNEAAERIFRCPAADALGTELDRFIPPRYRSAHRDHVRHFGETGQTSRTMGAATMSLSGVRSDGEEFPIDASISQVTVGKQRIFTVILRDITQRKQAEEELKQWQAQLERRVQERTIELAEANRELEAFGYSVSHDLRAPLRHVTGFVEMLDKHAGAGLDDKGRRYIRTIADASRKMGNLIDDLLSLSRIGRATINEADVDLKQIANDCVQQLAGEVNGRPLQWSIRDLPHVRGDVTLLRNVMMNLVGNAIKYTRKTEQAQVEVGAYESGDEVVCYVRDNGVGFDMQFAGKLFGVFQRLHRPEEFEGTGIGLASVRRIIQRHGGRTWAEGKINEGATVYFTLPSWRKVL